MHGFGLIDLDAWIWVHRFGCMDLDVQIWMHRFRCMDLCARTCMHGFGCMLSHLHSKYLTHSEMSPTLKIF